MIRIWSKRKQRTNGLSGDNKLRENDVLLLKNCWIAR